MADARHAADPVAATPAQLDQELAQQLVYWAAEDRTRGGEPDRLTKPLIEAAVWVAGAICLWVAVALAIKT
jgi:hypothetical protein